MRRILQFAATLMFFLVACSGEIAFADGPLDEDGNLVLFSRDIAPIFRGHCLECHGPEDAKADFRIDDRELTLEYIEPEDHAASPLYADYIASQYEDTLMPPTAHGNPLLPAEIALIRTWISEGANWPEGESIEAIGVTPEEVIETLAEPKSLPLRLWVFQGFFHPATVHFPIALFLVGGLFVVLGLKWPSVGTQVPLVCLLIGTPTAIASSTMGWAFAKQLGYGSLFDASKEIFWHRWSGIIVAVLSVVLTIIAIRAIRCGSAGLNKTWKIGLVILAGMVGLVGHQGGELHYGEDFYPKAFEQLLGSPDQAPIDEPVVDEHSVDSVDTSE
ncbi:Planctomycete cytochrome C [Roseimaritima multifibrata]|uniref:Planctomycete cytochrome C n=1 Tax=Roseimaritima multifibrata TaxID=1930274 RepID=A0A517MLL8_9BACT|nr:c-type cytochrome domain-containing protein [Roseimaritima multifibrata]QDS95784.1 Planctomycete cytochrome C [Roseimaritima multifibrata]